VDLLFASSGIEAEVAQAAELLEIAPGLSLPVATIGHLIALKVLARDDVTRPQDLADLRALLTAASAEDLDLARQAVALVAARGFNRGRDLGKALEELTTQFKI
jgi:predicted nucleotidyltransferase